MVSPRTRTVVMACAAAALVAVGIVYVVPRHEGPAVRIEAAAGAPGDPVQPTGSGATRAPAPRAPSPSVAPQPYQPPKVRSSRTPRPGLTTAKPQPVDDSLDGCDNAYGAVGQCVPWTFPPGTDDGCEWLAEHGFGPLRVHGRDRHGLDRDGDGIACGEGD